MRGELGDSLTFVWCGVHFMILNVQLNTKWYVPKAFCSPFIDSIAMAQTLGYRRCAMNDTTPYL